MVFLWFSYGFPMVFLWIHTLKKSGIAAGTDKEPHVHIDQSRAAGRHDLTKTQRGLRKGHAEHHFIMAIWYVIYGIYIYIYIIYIYIYIWYIYIYGMYIYIYIYGIYIYMVCIYIYMNVSYIYIYIIYTYIYIYHICSMTPYIVYLPTFKPFMG